MPYVTILQERSVTLVDKLLEIRDWRIHDAEKTIVQNIDFTLYTSQVNLLIGESGAGKSMLIKSLLGVLPERCRVSYQAFLYRNVSERTLKPYLGRHIGYISQDYTHSFNDHMPIKKQLIGIYRQHYQVSHETAEAHVQAALGWVGLEAIDLSKRYRFMLSGGQLERVLIASVMMLEPSLIIADEPTAALDVVTGHQIMTLLCDLAQSHQVTLLIVTHNLAHVARFSDYIYVMKQGQLIDKGTWSHFNSATVHPYSAKLLSYRHPLQKGRVE